MDFLPISLRVTGRLIVVIGGGKIATQKMRILTRSTATIHVFAKTVCAEIRGMHCAWEERLYEPTCLTGAFLVYACTNDREVNHQIADNACARRILVNVADDPEACDFVSPAIWLKEPMSVAVGSDATNANRTPPSALSHASSFSTYPMENHASIRILPCAGMRLKKRSGLSRKKQRHSQPIDDWNRYSVLQAHVVRKR
jgi:precorrin-2 dehydrogenase/sirohydrochlorin ferrochelatase